MSALPPPTALHSRIVYPSILVMALLSVACTHELAYVETAIPDRRTNMLGVETLFLQHIETHPEAFPVFIQVLTDADNALHAHRVLTRAAVMRWIDHRIKREGWNERDIPGVFFLRRVYLQGWRSGYLHVLDEDDRELLSDLISGMMGALHKCRTCTTAHTMPR